MIKEELENVINEIPFTSMDYLELYVGSNVYNVFKPNQEELDGGQVTLQENGIKVVTNFADGCTHYLFIPYTEISYFKIISDCPRQLADD